MVVERRHRGVDHARLDRKLITLTAVTVGNAVTSYVQGAGGQVPTETPAPSRAVRDNGWMEPDHAARAFGFDSFAEWADAVTAEMAWGVFDPARLHQLADLFADGLAPVTTEGAAFLHAWKVAAPPDGDLDPLYAGGWMDDNGNLTAHATRLWFDSLAAIEQASR